MIFLFAGDRKIISHFYTFHFYHSYTVNNNWVITFLERSKVARKSRRRCICGTKCTSDSTVNCLTGPPHYSIFLNSCFVRIDPDAAFLFHRTSGSQRGRGPNIRIIVTRGARKGLAEITARKKTSDVGANETRENLYSPLWSVCLAQTDRDAKGGREKAAESKENRKLRSSISISRGTREQRWFEGTIRRTNGK